jgi:hypothetical protein
VERTVTSLRELMTQVSGVGRSLDLRPEPCSPRDIVEDALVAAGLAPGESQDLRLTVTLRDGGEIVADRRWLTRVLVNLLTNARESLDGPGHIDIHVSVRAPVAGPPRFEISVRDDGRGMSDEFVRTRLFRPFSSTKKNGLGIGLAQCRTIVEAHGGRIEVSSRPGAGTTFTVSLPAGTAGPAPGEPLAAGGDRGGRAS